MSEHKRATRSKTMVTVPTPESGGTTSTDTNTWSKGTGITKQDSGSDNRENVGNTSNANANVNNDETLHENRSASGTVINATLSSRMSVLMAELEAHNAELARAQAAAAAAKCRLEVARINDLATSSDAAGPPRVEGSLHVEQWLSEQRHQRRPAIADRIGVPEDERAPREASHPQQGTGGSDVKSLADAIVAAVNSNSRAHAPKFIHELPHFDGSVAEWMAFKAVFNDTESMFSDVQNVARLRKAIRGTARETVRALLYTCNEPYEIIDTLERRYGRPDLIILTEVENIKRMPRLSEDGRNVVVFASRVANTVAAIRTLNQEQYLYAPELVNRIVEKLNVILKYRWFEFKSTHEGAAPDLVLLSRFLNTVGDQCGSMFAYENAKQDRQNKFKPKVNLTRQRSNSESSSYTESESEYEQPTSSRNRATVANLNQKKTPKSRKKGTKNQTKTLSPPPPPPVEAPKPKDAKCTICGGDHSPPECADFVNLSSEDRWERAKRFRLCFRCLKDDHRRSFRCKYVPCGAEGCEASHHRLLHHSREIASRRNERPTPVRGNVGSVNVLQPNTYLKIMPVELSGPLGTITTHALLDEGSSITLIERAVANEIVPGGRTGLLSIEGVGGHRVDDHESSVVKITIRGLCSRNFDSIHAHTINELSIAPQQVDKELVERCDHLKDIKDELCYDASKPTILIGQDNWHLITSRQLKIGGKHDPVASLTKLGWVLHGRDSLTRGTIAYVNHARPVVQSDEIAVQMMRDFFSIESLGIEAKTPKADPEQRALKLLEETCKPIDGENRFEAGLLWRSDGETMPDNRAQALSRLYNLERKLDRNAEQRDEYNRQVQNLIDSGYAERAEAPPTSPRTWYLPHFAVVHPQKGKIRLVFDAAAKTNNKSLNDALLTGPDLLQSLFGILIRFREGKIAVVADIKEMFLQIRIVESDRDSLRFLWRGEDRAGPPIEYRMKSLIFGAASSPCTAIFAKDRNAGYHEAEYPEVAQATRRNFYMDDYLGVFNSEGEAKRVITEMHKVHMKASFELRGWASNVPDVIENVQNRKSSEQTTLGKSDTERTLGLIWNHKRDTLGFNLNLRNIPAEVAKGETVPTKRQVTSAVMSVFDPLGLVSPVTMVGKALIQDVWRSGVQWDEPITAEHHLTWLGFVKNIESLKDIEIDRYVPAPTGTTEMHIFCDASEKVYATAIYLVNSSDDGVRTSRLVAGKARVAPLKPISIPRLELQAAVLGTRLAETVKRETEYRIDKSYYWSDSKTVLSWIKSDPRAFKSFVAHRLAEIESVTSPADWRWVPSASNVADDATKGIPANFDAKHRWFYGPDFLASGPDTWPKERPVSAPLLPTGEERVIKPVLHATTDKAISPYLPSVDRFSSYNRLLRSTATILLAAEVFKTPKKLRIDTNLKLRTDHLKMAELLLIKRSQRVSFQDEIVRIEAGRPSPKSSPLNKIAVNLHKGVLYLNSRLTRDGVSKIPILHAKEKFTRMLVHHTHSALGHGNNETVLNELQQKYHIIGLRSCLRNIRHNCQWCRTHRGLPHPIPTGNLPPERHLDHQPPFTATAVDYFGPMIITVGRHHEKRWGALYTCLTTRAVHIELATSLSASSMILTMRRMMARRGTPTVMYSDNGTNFTGAEREIREALNDNENTLTNYASEKSIVWKKIPPGAPNMGGAWERLVRSIKTALYTVLREKYPTEEVLHTLLLEAEHLVNSRPLTPVNPDLEKESLTPNHFLIGRSCGMSPFGSFKDTKSHFSNWRTAQSLAEEYWGRWVKEYKPLLQPRRGRTSTENPIKVDDIVLVVDKTLPRGTWPRGQVTSVFPGPDGRIRVAEVRTKSGLMRRPASRLIIIS